MRQVQVGYSDHVVLVDHRLTRDQLLEAGGYADDLSAAMLEHYVKDLPISDKQEEVAMSLLHVSHLWLDEPDAALNILSQAGMRCPTPREALSFAVANPSLVDKFEINAIGHEDKHKRLMMYSTGGTRCLFAFFWGKGPIVTPNACILATRQ
ncbi:MAG TPA: hypothetical protein VF803_01015 [Candidatus Paceibacterota bacterium]